MVTRNAKLHVDLAYALQNPKQPVTVSSPNENITDQIPQHWPSYKREHDQVNRLLWTGPNLPTNTNKNVRANNNS